MISRTPLTRMAVAFALTLAVMVPVIAAETRARAETGRTFTPVHWVSYPTNDSVELGDHSLNLVLNLGPPNEVVSSATHDLNGNDDGTASGLTVMLRAADGTTRKLPPSSAAPSLLDSPRVGLTPTSNVLEGHYGSLTVALQTLKPFIPNEDVDSVASKVSNGPFMYFRFEVTNDGTTASDPAALYVGLNASCGSIMQDFPRPGWRAFSYCNAGDRGGVRYLALPSVAATTWARGTGTVADFTADGSLGATNASGAGAMSLEVPSIPAGASWSTTGVYGAWNESASITAVDGSRFPFYYRGWWADAATMLGFAIDQQAYAFDGSDAFDAEVDAVAADGPTRWAAAHAFRGYRHGQWLMRRPNGTPFYAVTEGGFGYLSTVDVAYDYQPFQTWYEPWKSELELRQWSTHWEQDADGNRFLLHDLGIGMSLTPGQAYDQKTGVRRHMPVEENLDAAAMILAWEARTGRVFDPGLVQLLLDSAESHDTNRDGHLDAATMTACLPDGVTCRTSELGTTYDSGGLKPAAKLERGNTILTVKMAVVEALAHARGYLPAKGPDYGALASRHFTAVRPFIRRVSSDSSLTGYAAKPGYIPEALLYAAMLGRTNILDDVMPWLNDAMVANQASVSGSCAATCLTRYSSKDTEEWIAKVVAGDVISAWVAREWPSWSRLRPDGAKLVSVWANRTAGFTQGTFARAKYSSNSYNGHNWYPRVASLWVAAPGFPRRAQALGTLTGTVTDGGTPIADARVAACPDNGTCVVDETDATGTFRIAVAPTVAHVVSADAEGYPTTYFDDTISRAQAMPVSVGAGQTVDLGAIVLGATVLGTVFGTVTSADGGAVTGATVLACPSAGVPCGRSATTGSDGSYSSRVPEGAAFVWAIADGFRDEYFDGGHAPGDAETVPVTVSAGTASDIDLVMDPAPLPTIRIDAGASTPFTDASGRAWEADRSFVGGNTRTDSARPIAGTLDDGLYFTQRFGTKRADGSRRPFSYEIPLSNGTYVVTLRFAEVFLTQPGDRIFSVEAEGQPIVSNLDIVAEVGTNTADDKTATVTVTDGALSLRFIPVQQAPMVQAIEVLPA